MPNLGFYRWRGVYDTFGGKVISKVLSVLLVVVLLLLVILSICYSGKQKTY